MKGLHRFYHARDLTVLGIMNGTSLDGVDFVLTRIRRNPQGKISIRYFSEKSFSFPAALRKSLSLAAQHQLKVDALATLHHDLGRFYARCFKTWAKKRHPRLDLIGLHGQTVFHAIPRGTLQIGEASYLAATAGVPVIADFRVADIALGGHGAPIATLFHQTAFAPKGQKRFCMSVHNLGGISNLSLITEKEVLQAFDTGPANMLMDLSLQIKSRGARKFDKDGKLARQGQVFAPAVAEFLRHPYLKKKAPKSCGREEFGEVFLKRFLKEYSHLGLQDLMATLSEMTAQSIAQAYEKLLVRQPTQIVFCGGGAKNRFLLERIQELLPQIEVKTTEDFGWPVSAIEGAAFALLAAHRVWDLPSNLPKTTGASRQAVLGKIVSV